METKNNKFDAGHMTKMAAMPIYGKKPSKIFSGTSAPISMKFGMKHQGLLPIIVCLNDDPGMTYFTAGSSFETRFSIGKSEKQWIFQKLLQLMA